MGKKDIPLKAANHSSITFEMLFRKHDTIMLLIDSETGRLIDVNDAALRFYGYSRQQMMAMKIEDISQLAPEEIVAIRQRALREERIYFTVPHKLADGEIRTVEVHSSRILLEDKHYFFSIIHDITAREKAEKALRDSEERYRDLFNNANIGIFQTALEGAILTANPEFAHMFGFMSPEELISKVGNAANLFVDPNRREEIVRIKTENPDITTFENLYRRKDGSTFTGKLNVRRVVDSNNRLLFFEGFIEDITERMLTEEALVESELRYRTLFKSMGQGFYLSQILYDKDGLPYDYMYIDVNSAFEQILGLKKEQIIGKTYNELVPPDPDSGWLACFKRVAMTGIPENYAFSSKIYNSHFEVYAFKPEVGKFCALVKDVTESKRIEQALRESEQKLKTLFELLPIGISVLNTGNKIVYFNPALEKILDISYESLLEGDYKQRLYLRSDGTQMPAEEFASYRALWNQKAIYNVEIGIVKENGKQVWTNVNAMPVAFSDWQVIVVTTDITDRKRAEKALKESEDRFRKVFEEAPLGIVIVSPSFVFEKANPAFCRMIGYSENELSSMKFGDITHPDHLKQDIENVKKVGQGEIPFYQTEKQYIHRSGKLIWANLIVSSIRDKDGVLQNYLSMINDITERKKAEEALKESEEKYRLIIQNTNDRIFSSNPDGTFRFVNEAYAKSLNLTLADFIGKTPRDIFPPDQAEKRIRFLNKVFESGEKGYTEFEVDNNAGEKRFYQSTLEPFYNEQGKPLWALGISYDITERKRAEEALKESEEKYRLIIQKTSDSIFSTNPDGTYRFVNKAYASTLGFTPEEIIGKTPWDVFPPDEAEKRVKFLNQVFESGEKGQIEVKISKSAGKERVFLATIEPFYDEHGKPLWALGIAYDITERKRAEEDHLKSEKQFLQNQRLESLGIFAGGIAHDFNNLLGIIYGNLQLMSMDPYSKDTAEYLESCLKTMNRAKAITTQLLTFAKGGSPVRKTGNLVPFIRSSVQFALSGSNSIPDFNIDKGLWTLDYDENQIGQVFDNIIINATQAMPNGGKLEITAQNIILKSGQHPTLQAGDYVLVSFKDNGIGMSRDVLAHIFDPYFTTKATGRGLGLASVYSIVKNHDGCIDVESVQGQGSMFNIYLPASKKPLTDESAQEASVLKKTGKILIMDDEPDLLKVMSKMLKSVGCKTVGAADGKKVINLLKNPKHKKEPFMAVILDLTIPGGMGGMETVKEIRKFAPDLPVFVYSGYSNNDAMADPEKYGFTGSLKKPLERNELIELMNANL